MILSSGARFVVLQEVDSRRGTDQLESLTDRGALIPIPGPTIFSGQGSFGNAILTDIHPTSMRTLDLSVPGREPRGAIEVTLPVEGKELKIVTTHFGLSRKERSLQARALVRWIEEGSNRGPLVLAGDFNEWLPWSRTLAPLRNSLEPLATMGSFPVSFPLFHLDRIFVQEIRCNEVGPWKEVAAARFASDHYPLLLDFSFVNH